MMLFVLADFGSKKPAYTIDGGMMVTAFILGSVLFTIGWFAREISE